MNAVILSAALLASLPPQAPTPPQAPPVSYLRHVCPCGPGCPCGPACDCPEVAPVRLPPIRRTVLASPVVYPTHMAPMPAFRPYQPAPMYFGGFGGGGFGGCVGGA